MRVVFDTSVLAADFLFRSAALRTLRESLLLISARICVPAIVVDELRNKHAEKVRAAGKKLRQALDEAARLSPMAPALTDNWVEAALENFENSLGEHLLWNPRCAVVPYPSVGHEHVVRRALDRRKPFDGEGKSGYRDVLIWETVLAMLRDTKEPIAFISLNKHDFGETTLAPALIEDLANNRIAENRLRYFNSLEEFNKEWVTPKLQVLEETRQALENGTHKWAAKEWFAQHIGDEMNRSGWSKDLSSLFLHVDAQSVRSHVSKVRSVDSINVDETYELPTGAVLVYLCATATLEVDMSLHADDLNRNPDLVCALMDAGFDDLDDLAGYMDWTEAMQILVRCTAVLSRDGTLEDVDILEIAFEHESIGTPSPILP